jgi:hypothetical protein
MADVKKPEAKTRAKRTVKPRSLFMLYKGDIDPSNIKFTKDATEVLEQCLEHGLKYAKVQLPAPKRVQAA